VFAPLRTFTLFADLLPLSWYAFSIVAERLWCANLPCPSSPQETLSRADKCPRQESWEEESNEEEAQSECSLLLRVQEVYTVKWQQLPSPSCKEVVTSQKRHDEDSLANDYFSLHTVSKILPTRFWLYITHFSPLVVLKFARVVVFKLYIL
jgi:hypothetical protein